MDFLSFMPTLIRRKFAQALVLLLLIPLISLGDFTSGYVSTNTEEKAKTEVNPHATATGLNFTTAKIDEVLSYLKSFLDYASEEVVPVMKSFLYYTEDIVKTKIIPDFNRCLNFTGEVILKQVIPSVENFLYSAGEKANKEVVPTVKSFLSSSNAKLNAEVIPYVQSCLNSTMGIVMEEVIPMVRGFLLSVKEKMNKEVIPTVKSFLLSMMEKINKEVIPCGKRYLTISKEIMQDEVIPFIKRFSYAAVNKVFSEAIIPTVNCCLYFLAEIAQKSFPSLTNVAISVGIFCKEHPRLFLVVVLIICCVWKLSWSPFPTKMMKAPGRNYKISRADFERNPRSYFRKHKKKESKLGKIMAAAAAVVVVVVGLIASS